MKFKLEDSPSILNTLRHYYTMTGMEKKTGKPIEDWLYKAHELFRCIEKGQVGAWHLDTIEEYFGVPAYSYLLDRQKYYMNETSIKRCKSDLRTYLKSPFKRNGEVKFHIEQFRTMISVMV